MATHIELGKISRSPIPNNVEAFFLGVVIGGTKVDPVPHPDLADPLVRLKILSSSHERTALLVATRPYADIHEEVGNGKEASYTAIYLGPAFRVLVNPTTVINHDYLDAKGRFMPLMAGAMSTHLSGRQDKKSLAIMDERTAGLVKTATRRLMEVKLGEIIIRDDRNTVYFNLRPTKVAAIWGAIMSAESVRSLPFYDDLFFPGRREAQWQAKADKIASWQPSDYNPFRPSQARNNGGLDPELEKFGRVFGAVLRANNNDEEVLVTGGDFQNKAIETLAGSFLRGPLRRR